jgi:hypothetical protein
MCETKAAHFLTFRKEFILALKAFGISLFALARAVLRGKDCTDQHKCAAFWNGF